MAKFNKGGQWDLDGTENELMFKTGEKKSSGKGPLLKRETLNPNSEEAKKFFENLAKAILAGAPKQPTNEEMFGHLVPTEEQVQAAKEKWENQISGFYSQESMKNIDSLNKSDDRLDFEMEKGKSFNDYLKERLSEEELKQRNLSS